MRVGRRALALVPDWRFHPSRLEIELVALGTGRNGGRGRDAKDQHGDREQTAAAKSAITSCLH